MAAPAARQRMGGFTLLEMLIGLTILGLGLAVVGMLGPARSPRLDAEAAARELAGALQLARSRAIAENRVVAVTLGAESYSLDGAPPRRLPAGLAADRSRLAFAGTGAAAGGTVLVQAGERRRLLRVDALTGRVSLAEPP